MIASRIAGGVIWSYGNATTAPYTEQFYIGGANSVRAFSARSIGPGGYPPETDRKYTYINHVGDIRIEANIEYRFRMIADLHGAVFLDAGNVWLMRKDENRPNGEFTLKNFPKQIALGTGFGLRYDLDFLVFVWTWVSGCMIRMIPGSRGIIIFPSSRTAWRCILPSVIRSKCTFLNG